MWTKIDSRRHCCENNAVITGCNKKEIAPTYKAEKRGLKQHCYKTTMDSTYGCCAALSSAPCKHAKIYATELWGSLDLEGLWLQKATWSVGLYTVISMQLGCFRPSAGFKEALGARAQAFHQQCPPTKPLNFWLMIDVSCYSNRGLWNQWKIVYTSTFAVSFHSLVNLCIRWSRIQ